MTKTRISTLIGLFAALGFAAALPVMADTSSTTTTTTTTSSVTTSIAVTPTPPSPIDYMALYNARFTMFDIKWAHANGLDDDSIAKCYLLADKANVQTKAVLDRVINGDSFFFLARYYNLDSRVFNQLDVYKARMQNLIMAYNSTGTHAAKWTN